MLAHSVFTVLRNENKFQTRNKSKRTSVEPAIFRPEIVQYMKDARSQLEVARGTAVIQLSDGEQVYTDKQVAGLGKNYMRETARNEAVAAYTFFIQLYALDALLGHVESGKVAVDGSVETISRYVDELCECPPDVDLLLTMHCGCYLLGIPMTSRLL